MAYTVDSDFMPVNTTHSDYDLMASNWIRARDVLGGEDSIKAAGEKYLPKLACQSDEEYQAYKARAVFFNATARTVVGYLGMIFRKPPFLRLADLPELGTGNPSPQPSPPGGRGSSALGKAMAEFNNDADMLGTSLYGYAKQVVSEVISVGRCGTLVDWEGDHECRAYASLYRTEQILNWRVERVNGRSITTMVVLHEPQGGERNATDMFDSTAGEQIRVLRLDETNGTDGLKCVVDIWRPRKTANHDSKSEWVLVDSIVPLRHGKPLSLIPFVFHGPENSRPTVPRVPLDDLIGINLSHYRMDADYKHGFGVCVAGGCYQPGYDV